MLAPPRNLLAISVAALCSLAALNVSAENCVDTDGDGWGWANGQSCLVEQQQEQPSNNTALCVDSDGDGWGWDGSKSCIVSGGSDSNSGDSTGNSATSGACVDTDGDGWGWGDSGSCRVDSPSGQSDSSAGDTGSQTNNTNQPVLSGAYNKSSDLIALHFDHAPDPDDGHAAAAAFVLKDQLGLNVQVVGGTHGVYSAGRYVPASEGLMNDIWGQNWLDAHNNRSSSVQQAATRWAGTLASGGDVWIAEGGPSDFTAAVVRLIQQRYPEFQTRSRIHLVQHSDWNEDHALREDLNFVRSNTNYIKIADGNEPNSTADFRGYSQNFVDRARASQYSAVWNTAFAYLNPSEKLDFSDTVEVLYILGIGRSQIADADDFASVFF